MTMVENREELLDHTGLLSSGAGDDFVTTLGGSTQVGKESETQVGPPCTWNGADRAARSPQKSGRGVQVVNENLRKKQIQSGTSLQISKVAGTEWATASGNPNGSAFESFGEESIDDKGYAFESLGAEISENNGGEPEQDEAGHRSYEGPGGHNGYKHWGFNFGTSGRGSF